MKKIFIIILALIIVLIIFLFSFSFSSGIFENITAPERVYYALEVSKFSDKNSAAVYADSLMLKGGAGFIVNDRGYRVLACLYLEKSKCENVISSLKESGMSASVYAIKANKLSVKKPKDENQAKALENGLNCFDNTIKSLYNLFISLDLNAIDHDGCRLRISALKNTINESVESLDNITESAKLKIINLKAELKLAETLLFKLSNFDNFSNVTAQIKYALIEVAVIYANVSL